MRISLRKMAASSGAFFSRVLIFLYFLVNINADYVPFVIIGSGSSAVPDSSKAPNRKLTTAEFQDDYLNKFPWEGPLVLFIQDTLSLEDFDNYGNAYEAGNKKGAFQNLYDLLKKDQFLLLPAVQRPEKALTNFEESRKVLEVKNLDTSLHSFKSEIKPNTLILVNLPNTETASDRAAVLKRNDAIMGKVITELKEITDNFTVFYTARRSSWTLDQDDHMRISRNILAVEEDASNSTKFIIFDKNSNSTLLAATNIIFHTSYESFEINTTFTAEADKVENQTSYKFTIKSDPNDPKLKTIEMDFIFERKIGNWYLSNVSMRVTSDNISGDYQLGTKNIWAPAGFSYSCISPRLSDPNDTVAISLNGLQIQPFLTLLKFGDPYDCVGFFSIAIWMSIVITLMMIVILAFGIQQVLNINTMDRFDDPKGKSITVPNVD